MAHELSFNANGEAEFACVGGKRTTWHGFGQNLPKYATITDCLKAAHMEWLAQKAKVMYLPDDAESSNIFKGKCVLYRNDTGAPLGIVSDDYQIVQPRQAVEFFEEFILANHFSHIESLGVLKGGRIIWAQCATGVEGDVIGNDRIKESILITTSFDGTMATTVKVVTIRVVCMNTLRAAKGEKGKTIRVAHNSAFNIQEIQHQMGLVRPDITDVLDRYRRLAKVRLSDLDAGSLAAELLANPSSSRDVRNTAGYKRIMEMFSGHAIGDDLRGVSGTAYGLLNCFTEYVDHHARARSDEGRFISAHWGKGDELKAKAELRLLELID